MMKAPLLLPLLVGQSVFLRPHDLLLLIQGLEGRVVRRRGIPLSLVRVVRKRNLLLVIGRRH